MDTVRSPRVVYTRLEVEHSPDGRSGYQLLSRDGDLPAAVVAAIDRRVRCFQPADPSNERLQLSPLPEGRFLVARARVLTGTSRVLDGAGRNGIFLVECAVPDAAAMARMEDDPFAFVSALGLPQDARAVGDLLDRGGPGFEREVIAGRGGEAGAVLPADETRSALALTRLVLRGAGSDGGSILLSLASDAAIGVVRTLFHLLPPPIRRVTSFDSAAEGCPHEPGEWTLLAMPRPPASAGGVPFDPRTPPADGGEPDAGASGVYLRWLRRALARRSTAAISEQTATAWFLARRLFDEDATPPGRLDDATCREILLRERAVLEDHLVRRLSRLGGGDLGRRLAPCIGRRAAASTATAVGALFAPSAAAEGRLADLALTCVTDDTIHLGPVQRWRLTRRLRSRTRPRHGAGPAPAPVRRRAR